MIDWCHVLNSHYLKVGIAALSKELNLEVAAVHMRWSWLNAKFEAFQKKVNEKETTAAAASSADTTMKDIDDSEDTKEAEETEEAKGGNNDEDAEWTPQRLDFCV